VVLVLCLVAILFPFISAVALLDGVKSQSRISVNEGADIYVTMDMYGRNGVIPIEMVSEIKKIDGVVRAVPRVISRIYISGKLAVLLGLPAGEMASLSFVKGALPGSDGILIGRGMAKDLKLDINSNLSIGVRIVAIVNHVPMTLKKEYRVAGIFDPHSGIWSSDLVVMNIEDADSVFEMDGFATDIAVYVKPGYDASVSENLQKLNSFFRIQTKELVKSYFEGGFNIKGGIFVALYTVAFALAIPAILVSSGFGLSERRKEIGILKATGWQTHEVLEMVMFENIVLALISAPLSFVISYIWVKLFNGFFIAQLFIGGIGSVPSFPVPSKFMPIPFLLSIFFSLVLTMVGSIYSAWRAATVPPAEALR
jgi:ABC-type lipoprotein release transport system permease subunit